MQALILAGGEGTRLRPLTTTVPKPVLPLAGRPFLLFMIDWLAGHGVDEVILSCGFMSSEVAAVLGEQYRGIRLHYVYEDEPLGTAGPVKLAEQEGILAERLLVLNGDVLNDMDLTGQLAAHEATGARATLALIEVDDTATYGVVPTAPDGRVEAFLEKTEGPVPTNRINAGCYVLERDVIVGIPAGRACSFERDVFPQLVGEGLYGYASSGYWIDIGTPERYLQATSDLLTGALASGLPARAPGCSLVYEPNDGVEGAIGPETVIGPGCTVAATASISRSVLFEGATVGERASIERSVIAREARIGAGARVGPDAIVGERASIARGAEIAPGSRVEPGATVG